MRGGGQAGRRGDGQAGGRCGLVGGGQAGGGRWAGGRAVGWWVVVRRAGGWRVGDVGQRCGSFDRVACSDASNCSLSASGESGSAVKTSMNGPGLPGRG